MCFFDRRNAQRIAPLSSSRCQNGPLLTSKWSRVQVHQPANSPEVAWTAPSWRGGAFWGTKFTGLSSRFGTRCRSHTTSAAVCPRQLKTAPCGRLPRYRGTPTFRDGDILNERSTDMHSFLVLATAAALIVTGT